MITRLIYQTDPLWIAELEVIADLAPDGSLIRDEPAKVILRDGGSNVYVGRLVHHDDDDEPLAFNKIEWEPTSVRWDPSRTDLFRGKLPAADHITLHAGWPKPLTLSRKR